MRSAILIVLSAGLCWAGRLPFSSVRPALSFEPNLGQAGARVKFLAHSGARAIYITNSGLAMRGIELQFQGGTCATISGQQRLRERDNYFLGSASRPRTLADIPTFARVHCAQMYPGISADFYGVNGRLEYDLVIAPGSDPSVVRLAWKYAQSVRVDRDGALIVSAAVGILRQHKPVVYQVTKKGRKIIPGSYVLSARNEVRFSLGTYDADLPLIIDPVLFAVDSNAAPAGPIAVDPSGNIYLTGTTETSSFDSTAGSVQPAYGGGTCEAEAGTLPPVPFPCGDAYVIKVDPNGAVIYATYLGGDGNDQASSIAVDSSGNAYIAGTTTPNSPNPNNFPITPGAAFSKPSADGVDAFVAKLNATGDSLIYSTFVPELYQVALAIDAQGEAYVAGLALPASPPGSAGFPTTPGAFQTTSTTTISGGVAKLNSNGSALVYATYLGGSNPNNYADPDGATGVAVDALGNAHITGWTASADFPTTPGAFNTTPPDGTYVAYVAKLNPTGSALIYSTLLGETASDERGLIKIDAQGNAYVLGETTSSNFPVTAGAFQPNGPGASWASGESGEFLSALNAGGTALIYSTYLSGAWALDADPSGDTYVAGAASYGFPVTSGAFQRCVTNQKGDLFVAEFNPSGQAIGATYLGGTGTEIPASIVAAANGSPYIAGTTASTDFPGIVGAESGVTLTFVAQIQINNPQVTDGPCVSQILENAATFVEGPVSAGELVTIRGAGIGPANGVSGAPGADGSFPTELAGVQVAFDGFPAPLLYVQGQQINTVVPWEVAGDYHSTNIGGTAVSLQVGGVPTNTFTSQLAGAAPGIFVVNAANQAAVLNQDGTLNSPSNPAAPGSVVAIFGTGGGMSTPLGRTGTVSPLGLAPLMLPVTVQIGNQNAQVTYAGAAPGLISGMFQINAVIPDNLPPGSAYSLGLIIGSVSAPVQPTIAVQ